MVGAKIPLMKVQNRGYSVIKRKRSSPPSSAVVEKAAKVSLTNSWESQS